MAAIKSKLGRCFALNESRFIAEVFLSASKFLAKVFGLRDIPFPLRRLVSLVQPTNPLAGRDAPAIDIAIPCHSKDLAGLELVIEGARRNVLNPIRSVVLITPSKLAKSVRASFPDCLILTDDEVLGSEILAAIEDLNFGDKKGWVLQQVIKIRTAMRRESTGTLVLDADTILLTPKIWLDVNSNQILCISEEFHLPYKLHFQAFHEEETQMFSFVTHHQLMQKKHLEEIFGKGNQGILRWLRLADKLEKNSISEYDTYGEWIIRHHPKSVRYSKWNNLPAIINVGQVDIDTIAEKYCGYCSISNHSYLSES